MDDTKEIIEYVNKYHELDKKGELIEIDYFVFFKGLEIKLGIKLKREEEMESELEDIYFQLLTVDNLLNKNEIDNAKCKLEEAIEILNDLKGEVDEGHVLE